MKIGVNELIELVLDAEVIKVDFTGLYTVDSVVVDKDDLLRVLKCHIITQSEYFIDEDEKEKGIICIENWCKCQEL